MSIIKYNYTTDRNYRNDINPKNLFSKPYLKKQQSKVCFNSNKKKKMNININVYKNLRILLS